MLNRSDRIARYPKRTSPNSRTDRRMLLAAIAEARHALARQGRAFPFARIRVFFCLGILALALPQMAQAQHCGRIAYVPSMDGDSLSWELGGADQAPSVGDSSRIRKTGCEGPLCRSQTPQPFSPGSVADTPAIPFPWKCTAWTLSASGSDPFVRAVLNDSLDFDSPCFEPIPEPPRFV